MTIPQAIRAANDPRPISYRERQYAMQVLRNAIKADKAAGFTMLAKSRQAHLDRLMESRP